MGLRRGKKEIFHYLATWKGETRERKDAKAFTHAAVWEHGRLTVWDFCESQKEAEAATRWGRSPDAVVRVYVKAAVVK